MTHIALHFSLLFFSRLTWIQGFSVFTPLLLLANEKGKHQPQKTRKPCDLGKTWWDISVAVMNFSIFKDECTVTAMNKPSTASMRWPPRLCTTSNFTCIHWTMVTVQINYLAAALMLRIPSDWLVLILKKNVLKWHFLDSPRSVQTTLNQGTKKGQFLGQLLLHCSPCQTSLPRVQ